MFIQTDFILYATDKCRYRFIIISTNLTQIWHVILVAFMSDRLKNEDLLMKNCFFYNEIETELDRTNLIEKLFRGRCP